jgi:CheY-like chemotaxis protein
MKTIQGEPISILLVEDNLDHAHLVIRKLKSFQVANKITHLEDGEAALQYLAKAKEENKLPHILTTSDAETDIAKAYHLHANSYLVKPVNFENFTELMEILGFYWICWNKNPFN